MIPSLEESLRLTKNFVPSVSGLHGMGSYGNKNAYLFEIRRQCLSIHRIAVILRSDVHSSSGQIQTGNIVGTVPILRCQSTSMNKLQFTSLLTLSLMVRAPAARASSWWPKQMPKIGSCEVWKSVRTSLYISS